MSAKVTSSTTRKVVGSLGVIGAAAAVAGMGTFGSFTDSTTPVATTISSGTVSIDLTKASTLDFAAGDLIPGDSVTRTFTLKNDGSSDLGSVMLASSATTSSIHTTDAVNGLQLSVKSCAAVLELSARAGIDMPISRTVDAVCHHGLAPQEAVRMLMGRETTKE